MNLLSLLVMLMQERPEAYEKRVATIDVVKVAKGPTLDGVGDDECWKSAKEVSIGVDLPRDILKPRETMTARFVHDGANVHVLLAWKDKTKSDQHKPFVWSKEDRAYGEAKDIEDSCYLAFELEGRFNANMRAGIDAKWDLWQWKAARTNPSGYAMDKFHIYTRKKPEGGVKAEFVKLLDGKFGYIQRPEDAGKSATKKNLPPKDRKGDTLAQYEAQVPDGSAADVRAKGAWKDGVWTVEFTRKLKTGHADDKEFVPGGSCAVAFGFAREAEDEEHFVSLPYTLQFAK
jgi:hypothetical protein